MEIKIKNLSYYYNEKTSLQKKALDDINITIEKNIITGIIGKYGSGKTTLAELMNALMIPSKGNIKIGKYVLDKQINNKDIKEIRKKVGLVMQFPEEQFFNQTVLEEISFALKNFNYKVDKLYKQVIDSLKMVGLDETYTERNPYKLSSGEKRLIAIASVLVFNPQVIIFDEPTIGLDYKKKKQIITIIKMLKDKYHKTIIIITHDVDLLYAITDQIIVLEQGKVIYQGLTSKVFSSQTIVFPQIIQFINLVKKEKGIDLEKTNNIKDLIKDVYRHV